MLAICLAFLLAGSSSAQFAPVSSAVFAQTTISSSGTIQAPIANQPPTDKLLVAYGNSFSGSTADFVATHFDFLICSYDSNIALSFPRLKTTNPGLVILIYKDIMATNPTMDDWDEVSLHEDWFLHDKYGNRLVHYHWGWYAMDVGNLGWRTHVATWAKSKLDANPSVDGIMFDDTWEYFFAGSGRYNPWTVPLADVPSSIADRWRGDMTATLAFIKAAIGSKLLIPNTSDTTDYINICDGRVQEGFVHADWWALDEMQADWAYEVNSLRDISRQGKYNLVISGTEIPPYPSSADLDRVHNMITYCLASYLLGSSGTGAFAFKDIYSEDGSRGYYLEFDMPLGAPLNDYYPFQSVYSRDFTNGKVLVNPTVFSHSVTLGRSYLTETGDSITSINLAAYSGALLLNP